MKQFWSILKLIVGKLPWNWLVKLQVTIIFKWIFVNINFTSPFQGNFPAISFKIDQNCFKTYKYCDNTCNYYTCRWTHFSSIGSIPVSITSILTSIVTILASIKQVNTPKTQELSEKSFSLIHSRNQVSKMWHCWCLRDHHDLQCGEVQTTEAWEIIIS